MATRKLLASLALAAGFAALCGCEGNGEAYLVSDGLHPNAAGATLIAKTFLGAL